MNKKTKMKFNWITELKKAINKEPSEARHHKLTKMSGAWPTCACGQLCKRLPRHDNGSPLDTRLRILGFDFQEAMLEGKWQSALSIFEAIEHRTKELLNFYEKL